MTQDPFFDQPYSNRQLVLFVDDVAVAASQKVTRTKTSSSDLAENIKEAVKKITMADALPFKPVALALAETLLSFWEAQKEGVENFKLVEKSKISLFQLPPGHPRDCIVYAGHPGIPTVYVPLADFHRLTFEHKFAEVISLLMHLGAKALKVEHITGWGAEFSSHLAISLPSTSPKIDIGIETGSKHHTKQTVLFHGHHAEFCVKQRRGFEGKQRGCYRHRWFPFFLERRKLCLPPRTSLSHRLRKVQIGRGSG